MSNNQNELDEILEAYVNEIVKRPDSKRLTGIEAKHAIEAWHKASTDKAVREARIDEARTCYGLIDQNVEVTADEIKDRIQELKDAADS